MKEVCPERHFVTLTGSCDFIAVIRHKFSQSYLISTMVVVA